MAKKTAPPAATPKLSEFLCFAVYSTANAFNRMYQPLLEKIGLTYTQYLAMMALWDQDDQTVGSLGEKIFLESNTLTPMLKRLEAAGYITRVRDPADERQVRIRLTDAGRALHDETRGIPNCVLDASGLNEDDLARLTGEIVRLRQSLLQHSKTAA